MSNNIIINIKHFPECDLAIHVSSIISDDDKSKMFIPHKMTYSCILI